MAALTARSDHAYQLWIARGERQAWDRFRVAELPGYLAIIPVIDCSGGSAGLQRTIASLGSNAGSNAIVIGAETSDDKRAEDGPRLSGTGEVWICPIQAGDQLAQDALCMYALAIAAAPDARLIYADDDLIHSDGRRTEPHLKPNWNPELFQHHDFVSYACIARVHVADALTAAAPGGSLRALIDDALASGAKPIHVPLVLHHRVSRPKPAVPPKPSAIHSGNCGLVSVIIPTRNKLPLLNKCMEGLRGTAYPSVETIVIDNGSDEADTLDYLAMLEGQGVKVLRLPGPFNYSALNNSAVEHSRGELLCFLNNDVEMIDEDWLSLLALQAVRNDIGAVGPRLLYSDGTVQHAGVIIGVGGGAAHAHRLQPKDSEGYFDRARLPQRVSAVTAACMVLDRKKFLAVGGFDEVDFPVAFNDVDLCLKLNARGWQSFFEPRATLIHHESKSRGRDTTRVTRARFAGELAALKRKWQTDEVRDPYHHPNLSRYTEQFLLSV